MQDLKLQSMQSADLAACARLYAAVFNGVPWNGKWTAATAAKHIRESLQDSSFRGIVAFAEKNKPVGFAYGLVSQWENERRFYLKEMCVLSSKQRSGVGTRLLTHFISELQSEGVLQISLGTGNDTPARSFYERLGFEIDAKIIIMNKRLRRANSKSGKQA